jgi:hypothetical protein
MIKACSPVVVLAGCVLLQYAVLADPTPVTVGSPSSPGLLQAAIVAAYAAGNKTITIAPGSYSLPAATGASLVFADMKDVVVIAKNVDLSIQSKTEDGVRFIDCSNLQFSGANIHYDVPQTGQAKIVNFGDDSTGVYYDVIPDAGFPADADFKASVVKIGDSPHIRPGTQDFGADSIQSAPEPGAERIYWHGVPRLNPWGVQVGDYVVCRGPGAMMVHAINCSHCTFQNLLIYWGGAFGYFDTDGGSANRWLTDTLSYGPIPPGATNRALLSESADAFHCARDTVGPDIENCIFEGQLDDGIAIHGSLYQVVQSNGNVLTVGSSRDTVDFKPGDPIRISNNASGLIADTAVMSVAPSTFTTSQISQFHGFSNNSHYFDLTLKAPIAAPFDSLASDPAACGAGFKIINCTIRDHRARGMLIKADNGLIENNTIDGSTIAGIVISPETYWGEGGYSSNITIQGNTIHHTNYATTGPGYPQAGALTITGEGSMGQRKIKVIGNTFEDIDSANIEVRWADGVTISGNVFLSPHNIPSEVGDVGASNGCDGNAVIWIGNSKNVQLTANKIVNEGKGYGRSVVVALSAAKVTIAKK